VVTYCPRKDPIAECSTCCCDSSENVEFYNPDRPEPWCSAPPAVYTVTFVGTWTGVCQPDYYPSTAHWSPPTGASHTTGYQMWDACMDDASPGVAQVSQTGATTLIEGEYRNNSDHILDTFKAGLITGGGTTSSEVYVDKYHQWMSAVTMLAPSLDRMVGVANLRLCDGTDWKRSVKVCSELFSTASRSQRVHPSMQRNSVQWNNCSFGYFRFTFKEYQNASQETPTTEEIFEAGDVCPAVEHQPEDCRTCCCHSSPDVDFFHPNVASQTECGARDSAEYKVSLIPTISDICHPNLPFPGNSEFSDLILISHGGFQFFTRAVTDTDDFYYVIVYREQSLGGLLVALEQELQDGTINDYFSPNTLTTDSDSKRMVGEIEVTPYHRYVSFTSTLGYNTWVGFSALNLCGPRGWKNQLDVCLPLLAAVNKTAYPDAPTEVQGNNCAFGHVRFERTDTPAPTCRPHDESVFSDPNVELSACCYCEFILEGQVIRMSERYRDHRYRYDLLVRVTTVYYDDIGHIEPGDLVTIKVCSLPFRIKFKRTYRLTGSRELGTNEMEISENGVIANIPELGPGRPLGEGPCPPYILGGNCDDPR
jgi:hypothetical protein